MKKVIALTLTLCLLLTALTGCFAVDVNQKPLSTTPPSETKDGNGGAVSPTGEATEPTEAEPEPEKATLEESVIYDSDGVKITVKGLSSNGISTGLDFLVENNTDKNIAYTDDVFVINGIDVIGFLYIDVAAGKKANGSLLLDETELERAGIADIATISSFGGHITDTDSYDTVAEAPFELSTSIAGTYTQVIDDSGEELYNQDGIIVIAKYVENEFYGNTVRLLVKNETGEDFIMQANNISVNGFTMTALMSDIVYKDTVRFCTLHLFETELEENEIEKIEDVSFTLSVLNPKTYSTIMETEELQVFVGE